MKTKPAMDPAAAFPDAKHPPRESDLLAAIGQSAAPFSTVLGNLRTTQPAVATAWQYSERSGWYLMLVHKKRRLVYVVPKRGDVRLMMILGRKAVAQLQDGPFGRRVARLLKSAKHYPEGTAFSFDQQTLDPRLLDAFLSAKLKT